MSQPKMTSQNPKPLSSAERSLSMETYLPRSKPSMSNPPTLARVMPRSSRSFRRCCASVMASQPRGAGDPNGDFGLRRNPDGLGLCVMLERVDAHLATPPRLLHSAKRRRAVETVPHVDPHR